MADILKAPRGTRDLVGSVLERFVEIESAARSLFIHYGYREIRTPLFEDRALFERSVGDATDIVKKELYRFEDRKGRPLALRPEGTAGVVRAYIENRLDADRPVARLWYAGAMFRYERPQGGRYRQFTQLGCELFGAGGVAADLEMIELACRLLERLDVPVELKINHLGSPEDRVGYAAMLKAWFGERHEALCGTCHERLERNPLRLLDCKVPACKAVAAQAPALVLGPAARHELDQLLRGLELSRIPCTVDPRLVRGLDYYTGMVFEVTSPQLGAQDAVLGGGRYDGLVEDLGGPRTPAVGFAIGLDRLAFLLEQKLGEAASVAPLVYVVAMGESAHLPASRVARLLRRLQEREALIRGARPAWIEQSLKDRSLRAQMKEADRLGASYVAIVGEDEVAADGVTMRCMASGEQFLVSLSGLGDNEAIEALSRALEKLTVARRQI